MAQLPRGQITSMIFWRLRTQTPTSRSGIPRSEIGIANRPLPQAARSTPYLSPMGVHKSSTFLVIGDPGGGRDQERSADRAQVTAGTHVDPSGSLSMSPEAKRVAGNVLSGLSLIPGLGLLFGGIKFGLSLIPSAPQVTDLPTGPDSTDPTQGRANSNITPEALARAQDELNAAAAAQAAGDYNAAMAHAELADRLAGGVLGSKGPAAPTSDFALTGTTGLATDWGRTVGAPSPSGFDVAAPAASINTDPAIDSLSTDPATDPTSTGAGIDSYGGDPLGGDLAGVDPGSAGVGGAESGVGGIDMGGGAGGIEGGTGDGNI